MIRREWGELEIREIVRDELTKRQPEKLRHAYVPDGRGPRFDEGICVADGSGGLCGRHRLEHER